MTRHLILAAGVALSVALAACAEPPARTDAQGDPLPDGALARLGTLRFREPLVVECAALSGDGKTVAVASRSAEIRVLEAATGKELRRLRAKGGVKTLVLSPDGGTLAAAGDSSLAVWDTATGTEHWRRESPHPVFSLAFSGD